MAWLDGRPNDLVVLARNFTGDPAIRCDDGENYYLTSSSLDALFSNPADFRDAASSLLVPLNGASCVLNPDYRPVRLRGSYSDSEGRGHVAVLGTAVETATAFAMATVSVNGVPQEPTPSPAPKLARLAGQHPDVTEVFRLMAGVDPLDWFTLYKVFEIVRDNVGGQQELINSGWKSRKKSRQELSAFTASANLPHVSGDTARHARPNSGSPQHTMTPDEARRYISGLVRAWLDSLSSRG